MPTTTTTTLVTAANRAIKALNEGEASLARRTFQDTIDLYVPVSETFVKLEEALKAEYNGKRKWGQSSFIEAAKEAKVNMPSQSTVSRIQAMTMHTAKRADAWRKAQVAAGEGLKFNEYTTFLGKLQRNEVDEHGKVTDAGQEAADASAAATAKRRQARAAVTVGSFDFTESLPAKGTKVSKLETLLKMQADLQAQIDVLIAEIDDEAKVKSVRESVRKAVAAAVAAAKG